MPSTNSERKNYLEYGQNGSGIVGLTRAVVVSNLDPLFGGRVKVWIPVIHGFIGNDENPDETGTLTGNSFKQDAEFKNEWVLHEKNILMLPWAKVLSPGWAQAGWTGTEKYFNPTDIGINKKTVTNIQKPYGIYNMPKPGTEVFVMFEQNDPEFPVVVGSYHHKLENRYLPEFPIESFASHEAFKVSTDLLENQYNRPDKYYSVKENAEEHHVNSSDSYVIKSERGAEFIICEVPDKEHMLFRSWMFPRWQNPDPIKKEVYEKFTSAYPNFPNIASVGLFKTRPLFIHDPAQGIEKTIEKAAYANTTGAIPPSPDSGSSVTPPTSTPPDLPKTDPPKAAEGGFKRGWPILNPNVYNLMGPQAKFKGGGRTNSDGTPRPHNGIDLPLPPGSTILAPIDGTITAINNPYPPAQRSGSTLVGTTVVLTGADGMVHEFKHLDSWSVKVGDSVKLGQAIAGSGADRRPRSGTAAKLGIDRGHLHWDVYQSSKNTNIWKDTLSQGGSVFINPHEWLLGNTGTTTTSSNTAGSIGSAVPVREDSVAMTQKQLKQFIGTATTEKEEAGRTMGLEMILIEGEETIRLRHMSGSYIEIDLDGNINFYSVGDINFRGNRSFNLDVWGGFLVNAGAIYLKAKTVIKKISLREIREKLPGYGDLPRFFKRCNDMREADQRAMPWEPIISTVGGVTTTDITGTPIDPQSSDSIKEADTKVPPTPVDPNADTKLVWGQSFKPANTYADFKKKVIQISNNLKINPNWLMAVMMAESNLNPAAENRQGADKHLVAVGLIQFTNVALQDMHETRTKEQIAKMDAISQLDLVETYFKKYSGKMNSVEDVYSVVFWPAALGKPGNYIMCTSPSKAYVQNKGLDLNHDGTITQAELTQRATKYLADGEARKL